jgi:hypothetical protein
MRTTVIAILLLCPRCVFAQPSPCAPVRSSVLPFDPYRPSHTAIVRNYGSTLLAHAPLSTLLALDPYVPSEAALLRQLGGAIPLWAYPAYLALPANPVSLSVAHALPSAPCEPVREPPAGAAAMTTLNEVLAALERRGPGAAARTAAATPGRNSGISIQHAGRIWVNAGPAVRFSEAEFVRIEEAAGSAVYRRVGGDDALIYVPTTAGMVAPFRAVAERNRK